MSSNSTDRRFGLVGSLGIKAPVDLATTGNITLSGEQTIDGVVTAESRVLVWQQTNSVQNGIYDTNTGTWTRAIDANGNLDLKKGTLLAVVGGVSQGGLYFHVTSSNPILPGSTSITFAQDLTNTSSALQVRLADPTNVSNGAAMIGRGGQVVGSIAALRLLVKTNPSKQAFVTGYYAQGDGGGGQYYFDLLDTTTADNGGTVIVAADGGRWKLIFGNELDVRQFGCKLDGITDDTATAQACIEAAYALVVLSGFARQVAVRFPGGILQTVSGLTFRPFVNYRGLRSTVASVSGTTVDNHGTIIRKAGAGYCADVTTGDMTIDGITFIADTSTGTSGLRIGNTVLGSGLKVTGCRFLGFNFGISGNLWGDSEITGCGFESNVIGVLFTGSAQNAQGLTFMGNVFYGNSFSVVVANGKILKSIKFTGNTFQSVANGQLHFSCVTTTNIDVRGVTFSGNTFEHLGTTFTPNSFNIDDQTTPTIKGLIFSGNSWNNCGIQIRSAVSGLRIADTIVGQSTGPAGAGITLGYVDGAVITSSFTDLASGVILSSVSATANTNIQGCNFTNVTTKITGKSASDIVRNNTGYKTETKGASAILAGTTSIVVAHGLDVTPTLQDISITLGELPTADEGSVYVDTIGAANFTVRCRNNPGASNLDFGWRAVVL